MHIQIDWSSCSNATLIDGLLLLHVATAVQSANQRTHCWCTAIHSDSHTDAVVVTVVAVGSSMRLLDLAFE